MSGKRHTVRQSAKGSGKATEMWAEFEARIAGKTVLVAFEDLPPVRLSHRSLQTLWDSVRNRPPDAPRYVITVEPEMKGDDDWVIVRVWRHRTVLTEGEQAAMDATVKLWEAFCALPHEREGDTAEFVAALHRIQDLILMRPGRREQGK